MVKHLSRWKKVLIGVVLLGLEGCDPPGTTGLPLGESHSDSVKEYAPITLIAKGNGTIIANLAYPIWRWNRPITPIAVYDMGTGDVDGDGQIDLIIINDEGDFAIYSGKTSQWQTYEGNEAEFLPQLSIGDIDNNQIDDIVIYNSRTTQIRAYSAPDFKLQNMVAPNTISGPNALAIGDLDGDNQNDVVVSGDDDIGRHTLIYFSNQNKWIEPTGFKLGFEQLIIGDINADSKNELIDGESGQIIHFNKTKVGQNSPYIEHIDVGAVAIGDADNDGHKDLVIVAAHGHSNTLVSVAIHSGKNLQWPKRIIPKIEHVQALQIADLDGNGKNEIIVGGSYKSPKNPYEFIACVAFYNPVSQQWNTTDIDGLSEVTNFAAIPPETEDINPPYSMPQIVVSSAQKIHVLGGKKISMLNEFEPLSENGYQPYFLGTGDFNQDGVDDIVVTAKNSYLSSQNIRIFDGKNKSLLRSRELTIPQMYSLGTSLGTGDIDADGIIDIVLGTQNYSGEGNLQPQVLVVNSQTQTITREFFPYAKGFQGKTQVAVADMNNDGYSDIITGTGPGLIPLIRIFDGKTQVLLTEFFPYAIDVKNGINLATGDFNSDGTPDIVTATGSGAPGKVIVFDGKTQAKLTEFSPYKGDVQRGVSVATGDYNSDGTTDILTGSFVSGGATIAIFDGRNLPSKLASFYIPAYHGTELPVAMLSSHPKAPANPKPLPHPHPSTGSG